jgi:hypothetical protein
MGHTKHACIALEPAGATQHGTQVPTRTRGLLITRATRQAKLQQNADLDKATCKEVRLAGHDCWRVISQLQIVEMKIMDARQQGLVWTI